MYALILLFYALRVKSYQLTHPHHKQQLKTIPQDCTRLTQDNIHHRGTKAQRTTRELLHILRDSVTSWLNYYENQCNLWLKKKGGVLDYYITKYHRGSDSPRTFDESCEEKIERFGFISVRYDKRCGGTRENTKKSSVDSVTPCLCGIY